MANFKYGDKVKIDLGSATYTRDSILTGSVVVKLSDHNDVEISIPETAVARVYPSFEPGLVIRIASGYLEDFVALRTAENWHFSVDVDAIWTDNEMLKAMEKHGYEVIYDPSKEGNDD